ncbi:MaoC family dehydratase [Motiliproteus sp. SC1-56]|uniref:MaoC family dehydratase n=1 Tax=Motiliproteus sp. SC1-56 TaxID=2799565 RepID=UPI001F5C7F85|nr:MaoC family dehydratase [Motiliproteus sp. SC1-56]
MSDLHGYYLEDLEVGMSASFAKTVSESDVYTFAGITGDNNPVHINAEFAAETLFKERIVHGMFSAGLISAVLGTRLPGPGAIYLDQNLKFKAPVKFGETVTATATVEEIDAKRRRVKLRTTCTVAGKVVADGAATIMVDSREN